MSLEHPPTSETPTVSELDGADYWFAMIDEKVAAEFMHMTDRWLQAKRQHGGGPKFIRISKRCIRYRRIDLRAYAEGRLRSSTSDDGERNR